LILLQRIIRTWKNNSYIFEITKTFRSADKNRLNTFPENAIFCFIAFSDGKPFHAFPEDAPAAQTTALSQASCTE